MRRETRKRENKGNNRNILYLGGSLIGIGIISFVITFILYGNKMEEQSDISSQKIATLVQEAASDSQSASSQMGKTVEESTNEIANVENTITNTTNTNKESSSNITNNVNTTKSNNTVETTKKDTQNQKEDTNTTTTDKKEEQQTTEEQEEPKFVKPVEGEISKEYAKENLVYSETLQEWTTHLGVDIKADKTTVVKAAADGKIKSIKNDPRYGLSIIIEHQNGFETLYANLLTSEFVQVGEEVKQGQSIGTVGNTATFEIADEAHLHFEISKNNETLDPSQYIK